MAVDNLILFRRGTGATSSTVVPTQGEPVFDTGTGKLYIGDGSAQIQNLTAINSGSASSLAADNLTAGDAAITLATTSGNITIDAQAGDADIIFKGTDDSSDITALTLDMSAAGAATFNDKITAVGTSVFTNLDISGDVDVDGTLEADAITLGGTSLASSATTDTTNASNIGSGTLAAARMAAAQTAITSLLATDIKIGEDDQTKIDFETADEIHFYAANVEQVYLGDNIFGPQSDSDVDLGSSSVRWKDAYVDSITVTGEVDGASLDISGDADIDGTLEADAITVGGTALNTVIAGVTVSNATLAATATVSNSTANTNFPVVFHDESNALLDDTGALRYNPSSGTLLVPNLSVAGTTTTVDTVTMNAENAVIFEGATADGNETTLTIIDPDGDRTIKLPNQSGCIPVLAADSAVQISATPAELNVLDGITAVVGELNALDIGSTAVGTAVASKAVILDSNKDYTGIRNFTVTGELDAATGDFSGDVDIDGTLEADAITVNGTTLAELISDTAGAMFSSNTETGITATYQDADNTIDLVVGTLNQDTTGTAALAEGLTGTPNITVGTIAATTITASTAIALGDDDPIKLGANTDAYIVHDAGSLSADDETPDWVEGTSDHLGYAADSLVISNVTNDADIAFFVSDGGHSRGVLKLNGDDGNIYTGGGADLKGEGAATSSITGFTLDGGSF